MTDSSHYETWEALLTASGNVCHAAEAHGIWSGLLSAKPEFPVEEAVTVLSEALPALGDKPSRDLCRLFAETRKALADEQFGFDLLLPGDDSPLPERARALGQWCQGYLYGLGFGGDCAWSEQAREIIRDFQAIAQLDPAAEGEENECAFAELVEYARVGAQLLFTETVLRQEKEKRNG